MQQRFVKVLTVAVIALSLLAVPSLPPTRRAVMMIAALLHPAVIEEDIEVLGWPRTAAVTQAARADGLGVYGDLAAAQHAAAAEHAWFRTWMQPAQPPHPRSSLPAFRKAASLHPESPAAHLYLATRLLGPHADTYEHQVFRHIPPQDRRVEMSLTPKRRAAMGEAIRHLRVAARLAPDNSAPSYLLVYALFSVGDRTGAERVLRDAVARPRWSLYDLEVQRALLKLYERSAPTTFYMVRDGLPQYLAQPRIASHIRSLAHILTDLGDKSRLHGDSARAAFYYAAAAKYGSAMLTGANHEFHAFTGSWIVLWVGRSLATPTRWQQLSKLPSDERRERAVTLQGADLLAYFRSIGRADLAADYAAEFARARSFPRDLLRRLSRAHYQRLRKSIETRGTMTALIAWEHAAYLAVLLLLAGVMSVLLRSWRATGAAPGWPPWQWATLVAVALGPSYVTLLVGPVWQGARKEMARGASWFDMATVFAVCGGVPLLVVIVPVIASLLKRRRQPQEMRMGKLQAILASLRILLPPTFALLLLVAVILTIPAQLRLHRVADQEKKIIEVGEMQYWRMGGSKRTEGRRVTRRPFPHSAPILGDRPYRPRS